MSAVEVRRQRARPRIGFVGLGNMGLGMACRLAEAGYDLVVHNRTPARSEEVAELGARVAQTPGAAAQHADVVLLSLASEDVVRAALFGGDGVLGRLRPGGHLVDLSTISPDFAREVAERAQQSGHRALEASVYGAPHHARAGKLRIMVGGRAEDLGEVAELLDVLGKQVIHLGPSGMGATMKLVVNMLMGVQMPALAEAVVLGERAGLRRDDILELIAGSGYSSPVMTFRCGFMARRAFEPVFKLELMRKDMMLALAKSQELGVPLAVSESACAMLTAAQQQGLGDLDVAAILAFQERMAGIEDYPWPTEESDGAAR